MGQGLGYAKKKANGTPMRHQRRIAVGFPPDEFEKIARVAYAAGISMAEAIRLLVRKAG